MTTTTKTDERIEFACAMAAEFPTVPKLAWELTVLLKLARHHRHLQEQACNEDVPKGHDLKCENAIVAICGRLGCGVKFSGDPRGHTVKLLLPSKRSNNWGGEGWGVPQ